MDRRLLNYYNLELKHLREMGGEFAREFPKIAGRLGLEDFSCADPYVERLLEGFAFLAGRVHLKLDAEFPRFTQALLETLYPHYLAPTPSMAVVQFSPEPAEAGLASGFPIARGTAVRNVLGAGEVTGVEYRTAHEVMLYPLKIEEARYYTRDVATLGLAAGVLEGAKAALRLRVNSTAGVPFSQMKLDRLPVFLRGDGLVQMHLYENVFAHAKRVVVAPASRPPKWAQVADDGRKGAPVRQMGFEDGQAMLPQGARTFSGYRLLQEYFAFPQRFMFFELGGLAAGLKRCADTSVDLVVLMDDAELALENQVDAGNFALFCTPVVNLFTRRTDRIHVTDRFSEFQVVVDKTRPRDYEVYQVKSVTGYGTRSEQEQEFKPFYSARDLEADGGGAYYTVSRVPRMQSSKEQRVGARAAYDGSEVYLTLVDAKGAPYAAELRQLGVEALCTNRDLPLTLSAEREFALDTGAPVVSVKSVSGPPTAPRPSYAQGETAWRLVGHLSPNYLSLSDVDEQRGAESMRELLELYGPVAEAAVRKQINGVKSVTSKPAVQRVPSKGPIAFARGLEVSVLFDETAFEGTGVFLLGTVLDRFFARYVSINSFTRTVVKSVGRGEVMRWPARLGARHIF